jgi:hypothetical protein
MMPQRPATYHVTYLQVEPNVLHRVPLRRRSLCSADEAQRWWVSHDMRFELNVTLQKSEAA